MKAPVRNFFIVLIILLFVGGALFAGGQNEETSTDKVDVTFQTFFGAGQKEVNEGFFAESVREAFPEWNFNVQWFSYSAYAEKLNLQIASGDLPDLTIVDTNIQLPRMVKEGQIIALDDLLEKYGKNLTRFTPESNLAGGVYDGKTMAIMNGWTTKVYAPMIRKDWLDNLGLDVPETLEEFDAVIRAFTFNDPDGNGKDDTYGLGFREGINFFDFVFHAFGVAPGHHHSGVWRERDRRVEIDWVQPEMLEALKYIRGLFLDGVIIPESITFGGADWVQAFSGGLIGIFYHSNGTLERLGLTIKEAMPGAEVVPMLPPLGPGGRGVSDEPMHWGFVISKNAENPEELVKLMDWFAGTGWDTNFGYFNTSSAPGGGFKEINEKGQAVAWSPEELSLSAVQDAMTKEINERFYTYTRPLDAVYTTVSSENKAFYNEQEKGMHLPTYFEHLEIAAENSVTSLKVKPVPSDAEYWGSLRTKYKEIMSKIIVATNEDDADAIWQEWIDYWNANGGEDITVEVNGTL